MLLRCFVELHRNLANGRSGWISLGPKSMKLSLGIAWHFALTSPHICCCWVKWVDLLRQLKSEEHEGTWRKCWNANATSRAIARPAFEAELGGHGMASRWSKQYIARMPQSLKEGEVLREAGPWRQRAHTSHKFDNADNVYINLLHPMPTRSHMVSWVHESKSLGGERRAASSRRSAKERRWHSESASEIEKSHLDGTKMHQVRVHRVPSTDKETELACHGMSFWLQGWHGGLGSGPRQATDARFLSEKGPAPDMMFQSQEFEKLLWTKYIHSLLWKLRNHHK